MAYYGDDNAFEDRERLKEERRTKPPIADRSPEQMILRDQISSLLVDKKRVENDLIQTEHLGRREQLRQALRYLDDKLRALTRSAQ